MIGVLRLVANTRQDQNFKTVLYKTNTLFGFVTGELLYDKNSIRCTENE